MSGVANAASDVGAQGVGTLLNVLDLATNLRSGNLGNTLLKRQMLMQDPAFRESVANSPLSAGLLGQYGSRQPATPAFDRALAVPGVSSPDVLAAAGNPTEPQMQTQPAQPGGFQTRLPSLGIMGQLGQLGTETDIAYKRAQIQNILSMLQGGGLNADQPPMEGMVPLGFDASSRGTRTLRWGWPTTIQTDAGTTGHVPPNTNVLTRPPRGIVAEEGTRGPQGPVEPGQSPIPGTVITGVKPSRALNLVQLATAAKRAEAVIPNLEAILTPDPALGGRRPIDLTPSGEQMTGIGRKLMNFAQKRGGFLEEFTPSGSFGGLGGESITDIASRSNSPEGRAATALVTMVGDASQIAKALGEAGILSNQDVERLINFIIPSTKGTREINESRARGLLTRLRRVVEMVQTRGGSFNAADQATLSAELMSGVPDTGEATAPPRTITPTSGPPAARELGGLDTSPLELELLKQYGGP